MKRNTFVITGIAILLLITAIAAGIHLTTRPHISPNSLRVEGKGFNKDISIEEIDLTPVKGTISNAKGDIKQIDAQGILLVNVLEKAGVTGFDEVKVVADDEYSAVVSAKEVTDSEQVYLIQSENKMQMIVFGDRDSKRNVSNVIRLVVS